MDTNNLSSPLPEPSLSGPLFATLSAGCLLAVLFAALLLSFYQAQRGEHLQTYQLIQQQQQRQFEQLIIHFRQQSQRELQSLSQGVVKSATLAVDIEWLERWWTQRARTMLLAVELVDAQGNIRWRQGMETRFEQQPWFDNLADNQSFSATANCDESRCVELSRFAIYDGTQYLGEIRAHRDLTPLLTDLAHSDQLKLGILSTELDQPEVWQVNFHTPHHLSQQLSKTQLMPLADRTLLQQLQLQPRALASITGDAHVWSLIEFPDHYASHLYLIARHQPLPMASQLSTRFIKYGIVCAIVCALLMAIVWLISIRLSRRIHRYVEIPQLLVQGKYHQFREQLAQLSNPRLMSNFKEIDDSLQALSYQLEAVGNAVDVRNQEMERLSLFDSLTGLPNRHLLQYEIQKDLRELRQHQRENIVAIVLLDLDNFKRINDSIGHQLGDQILEQMGQRLKGAVRNLGIVSRLGGDEFVILLRSVKRVDQLQSLCQKILQLVNKPLIVENTTLVISCSIGVSVASVSDTYNDLLKHAEIAMYKAKDSGGSYYRLFNAEMASEIDFNLSMEGEIRRGFDEQEFTLYLQPKVSMDGVIKGFESLVRWDHPERGVLPPGEFIPAMENMGFISRLDNWILEASCRQLKVLEPHYPDISIAVNISSTHFTDHAFLTFLQKCLKKYPISPNKLELEITETLLMENMSAGREVIDKIKQLGVRIAIDDFGTGYSSLSYLKKLPVDTLKIDREFIKDIPDSESDMQISSVIIFLAKQLHFSVVAEGVETSEQLVFLKASQCDLAQGYYFSKPIPAHKAILMLESERIDLSHRKIS
tara:strand:+ start:1867 stop:4326 length:2460 start_codon:yes stop_codon:yes gene_type:complete